ncbi:MAG: erythromycin esterase family protein, partial [Candidatus Acidiferrum sp.]
PAAVPTVPKELTLWLKSAAIPLESTSPDRGLEDLRRIEAIIGNARIVAMGEETHGTREFFQMKHRMLEYLVEEKGFTIFGIEANWPESLAINDYVLNGRGDAAEALNGLYFWTWNTEEVLEMIQWMRKYNQDPKHTKKVKFFGFDMQVAHVAARNVQDYLEKVDPAEAQLASMVLAPVGDASRERDSAGKSKTLWQRVEELVEALLERLEGRRKKYVEASSLKEWTSAQHNLEIVRQAAEMNSVDRFGTFSPRDQSMAQNVKWIIEQEGPESKIMLWAHNGHVATAPLGDGDSMGTALRKIYGAEMVVCGFSFDEGSFQAIERGKGLRQFTVGPAAPGSLDAALAAPGIPLYAIDLRSAPSSGAVGEWLNAPQLMRSIGAVYNESLPGAFVGPVSPHSFDVLFFVNRTTAAHENPKYTEFEFRGRP